MRRKVARGSRGKSGEKGGVGDGAALAARPRITGVREHSNAFMPGLRVRGDGWTAARTRVFLASLGRTGCITDAARIAGVSTTSVNRSRALFAPFGKACGVAIARVLHEVRQVFAAHRTEVSRRPVHRERPR